MSLDYTSLRALAAVTRTGSFDAAAAELGVTASAVSQRIKALEEQMGAILVVRAQPCTATEAGTRLVRHVDEVRLLEHRLADDLAAALPAQPATVRIAVNADSLDTWFLSALAQVEGLLFDLVVDDQDHSADWLRKGEVSAAVTAHADPVQGCDCVPLGRLRYLPVASPDFVAHWFAGGADAASLSRAPAIAFTAKDRLQADWARAVAGKAVALKAHRIPSSVAFQQAVQAGMGWGMLPEPMAEAALESESMALVEPGDALEVTLYWQVSRIVSRALHPLTKAVRSAAWSRLLLPRPGG